MAVSRVTATAIKRVRKTAGLSQEAAARLMGVSVFSFHSWEQGRRKMRAEKFARFKQIVSQ